jgi:hypothetical protein
MKRPPNPFRYVTAEHTNKPGYLKARMRMYRAQVEAEKQQRQQDDAKVTSIKKVKP